MYRDSCGQTLNRLVQVIFVVTLPVLLGKPLFGRDTLALLSKTAAANSSATLDLGFTGSRPSAINWTLTYSPANVVSLSMSSGAAVTAASKTSSCDGASIMDTSARNALIISNVAVAVVNPMAAGVTISAIGIGDNAQSSPPGNAIVLFATGETVIGAVSPAAASRPCLQPTLNNTSATLAATGSAGLIEAKAEVTLTGANPTLTPSPSVWFAAPAAADTFSAMLTRRPQQQSVNAGISRTVPMLVSSMSCYQVFEQPTVELTGWQSYLLAGQTS